MSFVPGGRAGGQKLAQNCELLHVTRDPA